MNTEARVKCKPNMLHFLGLSLASFTVKSLLFHHLQHVELQWSIHTLVDIVLVKPFTFQILPSTLDILFYCDNKSAFISVYWHW